MSVTSSVSCLTQSLVRQIVRVHLSLMWIYDQKYVCPPVTTMVHLGVLQIYGSSQLVSSTPRLGRCNRTG